MSIESYQRSRNEIYVEVKGIYLNQNITVDNASQLSENLKRVREFIAQSVQPYLAQLTAAGSRLTVRSQRGSEVFAQNVSPEMNDPAFPLSCPFATPRTLFPRPSSPFARKPSPIGNCSSSTTGLRTSLVPSRTAARHRMTPRVLHREFPWNRRGAATGHTRGQGRYLAEWMRTTSRCLGAWNARFG